ncbi:MAG TPA: DEAD/DEAH box helicase, partial [bacterium]|nr:DEAD/DEAH box helicase [bacterium]
MKSPDTFVSFDLETTGLDSKYNEIIEIGAIKVENGEITDEFSELIKPENDIPDFITNLTGIRNSDVRESRSVQEVISSFIDFSKGFILLGQNVSFDMAFLRNAAKFKHVGYALDNIRLARILLPQLPSYSLDSLIEFFAITTENRHRALIDARITAFVFLKLVNMLRMADAEFANEMLRISSKTDDVLKEFFEAHIKERINNTYTQPSKTDSVLPTEIPKLNNIIGDFSSEITPAEPGEANIDSAYISSLLQSGGALSKHHDAYEERTGQITLAEKIANAFNGSELLLAEAGTGIGKSVAYLIPAILWAENANERVIISTNTKNLQEQLFSKDIPLLSRVLDFPFRAVILKGRGNYICLNRWHRLINTPERYLSKEERSMILPVASWLHSTLTGDLSETGFFPMLIESGLLERIFSDSPLCLGPRCKSREKCYVNRIRKASQRSHIIIVNHSLVFSDMVSERGVLGGYNRIVFDEAHNIEKVAIRFLGVTVNYYRVRRILNHLYSANEGPHGHLAMLEEWVSEMAKGWPKFKDNRPTIEFAIDAVKKVRTDTRNLFESLYLTVQGETGKSGNDHEGKIRYYENSKNFINSKNEIEAFRESLAALIRRLGDIVLFVSNVSPNQLDTKEEIMIELEKLQNELQAIINDIDFLTEASGRNVFWFEYGVNGTFYSLKIKSAPLDIAEKLACGLYDYMETVVMTSATLTVANDFSYIRRRLGLDLDTRERVVEFIASSPFNYRTQAAVFSQSFLPSPKDEDFIQEANEVLFSIAQNVGRGMLVLFTSYGHLQKSYYELRDRFIRNGITLLAQGIDGSRNVLLRRFQQETLSVLFGTDSFWEGIDVPGKALELVVILRLPFAVPTDPVIQAQLEDVELSGGNPFMDLSVPEAAIKLRQGAGRLIRHRNDKGAVIIMDKRIHT